MKGFNQINLKRLVLASLFIGCTIQAQGQTQEPFVTTWEVTAGDLSITIPTDDDFTYAYTVDWGDGTTDTTTYTNDAPHTYQAAGTYTVSISGTFPAIYFNNRSPQAGDNSFKIKTIKSWGTQVWRSLYYAFTGCENLTIEDGAGAPDLTMVTNMRSTFLRATSFNQDISNWNVSNVTDMSAMFNIATSFNGNISTWDVSNVTDMSYTFGGATSFNGDLSNWNVSNVTDMSVMFNGATSFNGNISTWDVSNVTDMSYTFSGATSFNGDLSTWNVSNVTSMRDTFFKATNFNGDLSSWNVSNVRDMRYMFDGATSLNGNISNWNVSNVNSMTATFQGATSFNGNISNWNVSNVTSMWATFFDASSFNGDLSSWNVSNVTNMAWTFGGATNFNGDLSSWNVSNVIYMTGTFWEATSFNGDISSWDVSNVVVLNPNDHYPGMTNIFKNATSFSSENYDALLTEWAKLSLQDDIPFTAPPTTYCSGEAGRNILINTYNWDIQGDNGLDCTAVTSVDDEFLSNTKIYPNPSNGKISIESSFEIDKLELYNVLGAKLFSVSKTNVLDLTSLRQGIYILKVFSEDKVVSRKVVVE